jgi:phage gp29-like protein
MVSRILGPDGQPVDAALLAQEIATPTLTGVRATRYDAVASGLTPERLAQILRAAAAGNARDYLTLAEEMEERYLHYASQVQTRRLAIEGIKPSVMAPKGVPAQIVDFVH